MPALRSPHALHAAAGLVAALLSSAALAQEPSAVHRNAGVLSPREFGIDWENILNIPAPAFVPRNSGIEWDYATPGYIYSTNGAGEVFWAPVSLPSGAHISDMALYFDDTITPQNITAILRAYPGFTDGNATFVDIAAVSSSGSSGKAVVAVELDHTVQNDTIFANGMYTIVIQIGTSGPGLAFKGVDLRWNRQLSPAPAQATFNDVPTDDFGFAYVEALEASGITAGCSASPPLFCPDAPLTRRQMAIFLARALGLHWYR